MNAKARVTIGDDNVVASISDFGRRRIVSIQCILELNSHMSDSE
jgi:hypothetical protein